MVNRRASLVLIDYLVPDTVSVWICLTGARPSISPYPPPNGSKGSGVADLELVGESAGSKCLDLMAKGGLRRFQGRSGRRFWQT